MYDRSYGPLFGQICCILVSLHNRSHSFLAILIKILQNVYGHKSSLKIAIGLDRTCMNGVMAPYTAKCAVFKFVYTIEATM